MTAAVGTALLVALPLALVLALGVHRRRCARLEGYLRGGRGPELWPRSPALPALEGRWRARSVLLGLGALALGISFLGPSLGTRERVVLGVRPPLVILLDVSLSMAVEDAPLGRLGQARGVARRAAARDRDRDVALVVFGSEAATLLPLSPDREMLGELLDAAGPHLFSHPGTEIAPALREATALLEEAGFPPGSEILILSDGEGHDPSDESLALVGTLREAGVVVSAVSVGTEEGGPVPAPSPRPMEASFLDPGLIPPSALAETEEARPWSRARPDVLSRLAGEGGGHHARAGDAGETGRLLAGLGAAGARDVEVEELPVEGWPLFLVVALLALALELRLGLPTEQRGEGGRARAW